MKKAVLFFVVLSMALSSSALAADIDLTILPYKELIDLKIRVEAEVMSRSETKSVSVPVGVYEIGVHIPAGEYSLELDSLYAAITVSTSTDFSDFSKMVSVTSVDESGVGRIVLSSGQFVNVEYGSIRFMVFTGLGF